MHAQHIFILAPRKRAIVAAEGSLSVSTDTSRRNFRVRTLGIQTHVVAATTPIIDSRPLRRIFIYIDGDYFLILELVACAQRRFEGVRA